MALAGCTAGTVPVLRTSPQGLAAISCAGLLSQLPNKLQGHDRRAIEPADAFAAAWGNPSIVLRCGVAKPATLVPTSQVLSVNGIDWLPEQLSNGYRFTTSGRAYYIEVTVPSDYAPEAGVLTAIADPILRTIPAASGVGGALGTAAPSAS